MTCPWMNDCVSNATSHPLVARTTACYHCQGKGQGKAGPPDHDEETCMKVCMYANEVSPCLFETFSSGKYLLHLEPRDRHILFFRWAQVVAQVCPTCPGVPRSEVTSKCWPHVWQCKQHTVHTNKRDYVFGEHWSFCWFGNVDLVQNRLEIRVLWS